MEISRRLMAIANMVEKCNCLLDVGTDHGYVPIYIMKNKICNKVIASDINKGPILKAKENIEINKIEGIELRQGSGLNVVQEGEADVVIIAGMGGHLISELIIEREDIFKKINYAVLQPVQNSEFLRKFLINRGYEIISEDLVFDESIFYEIIKVRYGVNVRKEEEIFYEVGRKLIDDKNPKLHQFLRYKISKKRKILEYIKEDTKGANIRRNEVEENIAKLEKLL